MKRIIVTVLVGVLPAACSGGGGAVESSRGPHPESNANAAVVVWEFADFQCPACQAVHGQLVKPLLEKYGSEIRFEFKHFPLRSIHQYALDAAESAECAADQGKFWEFVDLVFEKQPDLDRDALVVWAGEMALDVPAFEKCWKSRSKKGIVLKEYGEGRGLGVAGTPTFFVNGRKITTGFDTVSEAIEAQLGEMRKRL